MEWRLNMENLFLEDFTKYKFLSSIKFSPNGLYSAFVGHDIDLDLNKYISSIYLFNHRDSNVKKLTTLGEKRNFIWKDNNTLLFPSLRSDKEKKQEENKEQFTSFYEINIHNGESKKVFEFPFNVKDIKFIDQDNIILTGQYDPNIEKLNSLSPKDKEDFLKDLKNQKDFQVVDEIPFWGNGQGFTNKLRNKLYIYNIKGDVLTPVTDTFTNIHDFHLNHDKSMVVLITNSFIDKKYPASELQTYDIAKDKLIKISPIDSFSYSYANFLDDKICFIGSDMKDYGINQNPHFYLVNHNGQNMSQISRQNFNFSVKNSIGSDCRYGSFNTIKVDDNHIYYVTTEGDSSFINRINIDGKMEKLTNKKGSIDCLDVHNGYINFIGLRSLKLQELYSLDNKTEKQLTHFNEWVIKEKTLSIPEKLTFKTDDEVLIEGWVMKPVGFQQGKTYPAILNIHGGPKTAYGEVFFHEMQYWANQGYTVFFCNPRGSDGRGNSFADIRGKYGTIDYEDIMDFTDLVLEKYHFIDKNRLGVTGGSYGGFMTNWIIGQTGRFKAAVSQRSISNWISKFATTDIGYYFVDDQINGTPWNDFQKLWNHSPMKYADKVVTPTLFIHSEEDYRCWLTEGIQMFTSLKYHGVESRLCIFKGENHELSRSGKPKSRIKRLNEITNWFDKYLK